MPSYNINLDAVWAPDTDTQYTITYQAGENGILTGGNQIHKLYYGDAYPMAPVPVANNHYIFAGWTPALPRAEDKVTEDNITREEVAAVFCRLLMNDYRGSIMTCDEKFPDVEANTWSTKYIATLTNGKILEGYEDGTFRPHNFITKAELAAVASRFDNLSPFEDDSFTDIAGHWANKYINSAAKKGWVNGNPDGTFKPDKYITRAELATLV